MQTNQDNIIRGFGSLSGPRGEKPNEVQQPGKNPETNPTPEPEPEVWPKKETEIRREKEPLTTPPSAPQEIPEPPEQ